jgi:anti-sigma regulatory factor (Ser/Thr protein kinase)
MYPTKLRSRGTAGPAAADADTATMCVPAVARHAGTARCFAASVLEEWGLRGCDHDAVVLVVGELASNAGVHGRATLSVTLSFGDGTVCVDVVDFGERAAVPRPRSPDGAEEYGRGLEIVASLADVVETRAGTWGHHVHAAFHQVRRVGPVAE